MKKIAVLYLSAMMLLSLAACGAPTPAAPDSPAPAAEETAPAPQENTPEPAETVPAP